MSTHPDPHSFDGASEDAASVAPETLDAPENGTRHDGWTPARQAGFLRELSATHNVAAAARAVGMSCQSAYKLRARLHGSPFDKAWDAAFVTRFDVLAETALDRALNGVEVPHYYNGELIGTSRRYDERLTMALLAMRRDLAYPEPRGYESASAFRSNDIAGLIERVEHGPQEWRETAEEELRARFGEHEYDLVEGAEGGGPPYPVSPVGDA